MSSSSSANLLPQLLSKQRPFEFSRHGAPLAESSRSDNDYIFSDCKILAAMDEKFRDLLPQFEALKRVQCYMKTFLQSKADKIKRGEDEDSTDSEDEDATHSEDDDTEIVVPVVLIPFSGNQAERAKLETRSFIFKIWLCRIDLIRVEDNEKYAGLQDFEHAIYNAQEGIKEYREFIYKEYYNTEELEEMCPFYVERLEETLRKVLEEKEKAGFEMTEEDFVLFHSYTARLCALLGLKLNFLDRLEEMPPEHRDHRTLGDWIVAFLGNNSESITSIKKNFLTKEFLDAIGFDLQSPVIETIITRSDKKQQHIEACEWAEIFIRDEFKYNPLLSSLSVKFPFQANLTNSWFQLPSATDEEIESEIDPCHVNIKNLVTEESHASRITQAVLNDFVPQDEKNILLYHGTDHFSAADILVRGIDLCAGRQKRDFSCGSGFYLTNSLDHALDWAKTTTAKPAILVFKVKREDLDGARKLNLNSNEESWREIVSAFRSGQRTAKTRKSLSSYDLIEGPMATVTRSEASDELVLEPKPSSYQMCLISDDFADTFHQNLHSILFFHFS